MSRTMYDSTNVADIPAHATMVAGYVDGLYANVPALRKRFPKATVVTITVKGAPGAHVIDCEPGDMTPATAAQWAAAEVKAGRKPTIYCMLSAWPQVKAEVHKRGITGKVSYWLAHYDGVATVPAGAVAVQYGDPNQTHHHYDISAVGAYWPGVDHPAKKLVPARRHPKVPSPKPAKPATKSPHAAKPVRWGWGWFTWRRK